MAAQANERVIGIDMYCDIKGVGLWLKRRYNMVIYSHPQNFWKIIYTNDEQKGREDILSETPSMTEKNVIAL